MIHEGEVAAETKTLGDMVAESRKTDGLEVDGVTGELKRMAATLGCRIVDLYGAFCTSSVGFT